MAAKRVPLLTWMQLLGCFCVIFGHSYPFVTEVPKVLEMLQLFLYSFHMPLFVFCSGVLLVVSSAAEKYTFGSFVKRRAKRLLLPYFAFSLLGIVPKILLSPLLNDSLSLDTWQIVRAFFVPRENIWGHFWFLPMIFLCGVLGYWLSRIKNRYSWSLWAALILSFGMFFLPETTAWLAINDLIHLLFYFILGMLVSKLFISTKKVSSLCCYSLGSAFIFLALAAFLLSYEFGIVPYAESLVACLMIFAVAMLLFPISCSMPLRQGSVLYRSYSIFILSWPCQLAVEVVLERILHLPYWCVMPCMLLAGAALPCLILWTITRLERNSKYKLLSQMIGG